MVTIDQKIAELISEIEVNGWPIGNVILCTIAILLCVVLCGFVGFEREKRGRSAGLRTHLLVGVGSCIIMIISIYGFPEVYNESRDVARLAAGVLTGVGFLGAGAIIHDHGNIKGLTTAGTIWLVMAIGLACGSFNFLLAFCSTAVVMIVLTTFRKVERRVTRNIPLFSIISKNDVPTLSIVLEYAKKNNLIVSDVTSEIVIVGNDSCIETIFKLSSNCDAELNISKIEQDFSDLTKALSVQILNRH